MKIPPRHDCESFIKNWSTAGPSILQANYALFQQLLAEAKALAAGGDAAAAAAWCEITGFHAAANPCGLFASPELEAVVAGLSYATFGRDPVPCGANARGAGMRPKRVLHVATYVHAIGGLTRMILRWIGADHAAVHSIALIRQRHDIPDALIDAIAASGGMVHDLSRVRAAGLLDLARGLRQAAAGMDLLVLHVDTRDTVPMLAFAAAVDRPPIAYLDHADHALWIGRRIADVVISLRSASTKLAVDRRGMERERCMVLPIPVPEVRRTMSRARAKRHLGLDPGGVMLLSVARAVKYRPVDGASYADAHLSFLKACPGSSLVVLGSGDRSDWARAQSMVPGRIRGLPESEDTAPYFQAADIYVDSFPFLSITSLLEAGTYGVPLVSRFPFPDEAEILGAIMPGLDGHLLRARSLAAYTDVLLSLANDAGRRERLGEAVRLGIAATHQGKPWIEALERVYAASVASRPSSSDDDMRDSPCWGSPDVFLPFVHGSSLDRDALVCAQLALMPVPRRLRHCLDLAWRRGLNFDGRHDLLKCWVPTRTVARWRS